MMSWKTINRILGLAAVDQRFWHDIQRDPLAAIQARGFELTAAEKQILGEIAPDDLSRFSQCLLDLLAPDAHQSQKNG